MHSLGHWVVCYEKGVIVKIIIPLVTGKYYTTYSACWTRIRNDSTLTCHSVWIVNALIASWWQETSCSSSSISKVFGKVRRQLTTFFFSVKKIVKCIYRKSPVQLWLTVLRRDWYQLLCCLFLFLNLSWELVEAIDIKFKKLPKTPHLYGKIFSYTLRPLL